MNRENRSPGALAGATGAEAELKAVSFNLQDSKSARKGNRRLAALCNVSGWPMAAGGAQ